MKVCLMGMDERTKHSISLVFKHRTNDAISVDDEESAEIAIMDLDHESSLKDYRSACAQKPALRAIGLSSRQGVECDDILVIQKPIAAGRLLDAIKQVSGMDFQASTLQAASVASSLSGRTRGARKRLEQTPLAEDVYFEPEYYLMGAILKASEQARERNKAAVIRLHGGQVIILDRQSKMIQTNCAQARLLSLFSAGSKVDENSDSADKLKRTTIEYMTADQAEVMFGGKTYGIPREQLMWSLGSVTSQGRLPMGVDVEERLFLQRWPNMTHLACSADEMRIVSYWMRQPASLSEIAEALDIPEQQVFSVYTAAFASGLVGEARREVDSVWQAPDVSEHKERGLFSSIMKRLLQRKPSANEEVGVDGVVAA